MNIFLTGLNGFSGSHITHHLLNAGHNVYGVTRSSLKTNNKGASNDNANLTLIQADLNTLKDLPKAIDAVIHTAATSPTSTTKIHNFIYDNIIATERLIDLAKIAKAKSFIYLSSLSVYGDIEDQVVNEHTSIKNPNAYGASKLFGELLLKENAIELPSVAFRLPGIIGKGAARHWLSNIVNKAINSEDIKIYNSQSLFNNAVHIKDLCLLIDNVLNKKLSGFSPFTLGANGLLSIQSVINKIISYTQSDSKIIIDDSIQKSFTISSEEAIKSYQYNPMNISEMLDKYLEECALID